MPAIQTLLAYYGVISLATMLFFWGFTLIGYLTPELKKAAENQGMTLTAALLMGLLLGVTWPKSMFGLLKFMRNYKGQ